MGTRDNEVLYFSCDHKPDTFHICVVECDVDSIFQRCIVYRLGYSNGRHWLARAFQFPIYREGADAFTP